MAGEVPVVRNWVLSSLLLGGLVTAASEDVVSSQAVSRVDTARIDAIRDALLRLPYYGVFDFLTFTYEKGHVVLGGYAYRGTLPSEAERAVKRVSGVDSVTVHVKRLSVSSFDDDVRWRVFYAIYTNAFLEKYAPGGGLLWGHRHPVGDVNRFAAFPGMQPVGTYPIHIVVEGGRVRLLGIVDSDTDRTVASMAARGVSGTFGVDNELVVDAQR